MCSGGGRRAGGRVLYSGLRCGGLMKIDSPRLLELRVKNCHPPNSALRRYYGSTVALPYARLPLWITPSAAVVVYPDQLDASPSKSRFSRRKGSEVVPADAKAFAREMAVR